MAADSMKHMHVRVEHIAHGIEIKPQKAHSEQNVIMQLLDKGFVIGIYIRRWNVTVIDLV